MVALDLYIHMTLGALLVVCIFLLHVAMVAHMQDPFSEFHNVLDHTHRLSWSLAVAAFWDLFRLQYYGFMVMGDLKQEGERFYVWGHELHLPRRCY